MHITMISGRAIHSMGTFVASLSAALREAGDEVEIIGEPTSAKQFRFRNVLPLWLVPSYRPHALRANFKRLKAAREVLRHTDVIHAHGTPAVLYAMLLTLGIPSAPPLFVSLYEKSTERRDDLFSRLFYWWMGRRAELISGSSRKLRERIDKRAQAADSMVSTLVSPRVERLVGSELLNRQDRVRNWAALARREKLRNRGQLVLVAGNIEPEKRLDRFVHAMEHVTYPATPVVIGDGDAQLLAQLRSQGAESQVAFLGWRKNLDEWLEAASVLVLTSEWEARAFIVQEAMALGLPVVAPPVGRLRDLLLPEGQLLPPNSALPEAVGGILTDTSDAAGTARAITRLLSEPDLWYEKQRQARQRAAAWPSIEDVAKSWQKSYREARHTDD